MSMFGLFGPKPTTTAHAVDAAPTDAQATFNGSAEQAGLLFTAELGKAIEECKSKVEGIAKQCRAQNRKFRDIEFDLEQDREHCLHGLPSSRKGQYDPSDVQRVSQIFDNPQFFVDGVSAGDIVQGAIGDCWFVSALSSLAVADGLIEKICVARDEKFGVYGFIFFRDVKWVTVIIDDLLFTDIPKFEDLSADQHKIYHGNKDAYARLARKGGKTLYFARSETENETWVPLIEKAYAKLHGDYASLSGGFSREAIEDMTGGTSICIFTKDIADADRFWNEELLRANKDRIFGCSHNATTVSGLYGGHAYSVVRAVEHNGKRFVAVRNPWGESEWTGRWSDGSKEWTSEWLAALDVLGHTFGDDGQFLMEYEDFLMVWDEIDRTLLFDSSWVMSTQWLRVVGRPPKTPWAYGDVSFTIAITSPTPSIIVLSQLDDRFFDGLSSAFWWKFDFVVFLKGAEASKGPIISSSRSMMCTRSVSVEVDLGVGEYVVHVRLDRIPKKDKSDEVEDEGEWDERKLVRVMAEYAMGQSIVSNFNAKKYLPHIPVSLESLAGQDLETIHKKAEENRRAEEAAVEKVKAEKAEAEKKAKEAAAETPVSVSAAPTLPKQEPPAEGVPAVTSPDTVPVEVIAAVVVVEAAPTVPDVKVEAVAEKDKGEKDEKDSKKTEGGADADEVAAEKRSIFFGILVYTNVSSPAVLGGQLRHELEEKCA